MTFLLDWSLRAVATISVGLLLCLAFRRRSAATRNLVLRATLAVALALPFLAAFAPCVEVTTPAVALPALIPIASLPGIRNTPAPASPGWTVERAPSQPVASLDDELGRRSPFGTAVLPLPAVLLILWATVAGLLVLRWLAGFVKLLRLRRDATPTDKADVWRAAVPVPATYGRTILLPFESDAWPEARIRAAILHERAHVARHDWYWQILASLFAAFHWPNPAAWLLVRQLRDTAEAAADDEALAHMTPSDYARELLAVAKSAGPVGPALAMARRGGVRDRVVGILTSGRERRGPSARTGVLLFVIVAACGVAVAGVARGQDRSLRLIDVDDVSGRYWDSDGHRIAKRTENVGYQGIGFPQDERWVKVHLDLEDSPEGRGIRVEVPPPAEARSYGASDIEGRFVELLITAPQSLRRTNVRVGLAKVDWREIPGSGAFKRTVKRVIGGNAPQYILGVDFPPRYRNEQVRIVARLHDGTEPKTIGTGLGYQDAFIKMHGSPEASIQVHGHPGDLVSVVLQHRPFVWTTIQNVALRPDSGTKPSVVPTSIQNGQRGTELIGLAEGKRAWKADGSPAPDLHAPTLGLGDHPAWRQLTVALRVPGHGRATQYVRATAWAKYAYPSQNGVFEEKTGDARTAWCRLEIRPEVKIAKLGVDLEAEPVTLVVDAKVGDRPGEATVRKQGIWHGSNGKVGPSYAVTLNGIVPPGRDHLSSLRVYGTDGKLCMEYAGALAFGPGGSYVVAMPPDKTIGRVVLTSYAIQHARFMGVHLYPNP